MTTRAVQVVAFAVGAACAISGMVVGWVYGGPLASAAGGSGGFVVGLAVVGIVARGCGWKPDSEKKRPREDPAETE